MVQGAQAQPEAEPEQVAQADRSAPAALAARLEWAVLMPGTAPAVSVRPAALAVRTA